MHTLTHDGLGNTTLDILVVDTCFLLEFFESRSFVDSVIGPQSENEDLFFNPSVSENINIHSYEK
jgi:hypothetical protein